MESVLRELEHYWRHFLDSDIAKAYRKEVETFKEWLRNVGVRLLALRAREAAERGNPVARDYPEQYVKGLVKRGQAKILVNMFAAYLVERGVATQYWLIRKKYVAGGESIATWLRLIRKL
ncbi:MAG: hypothetical protein ABWK05_04700 [Pyrobaculum sp.]